MAKTVVPFKLLVVIAGSAQTGGGFHQSITNLETLLRAAPKHFIIDVLPLSRAFDETLRRLLQEGKIESGQVLRLPAKLTNFRDRVISSEALIFRLARWALNLSGRRVGMSARARFIDNSDADLVYFLSPVPLAKELLLKPFVWTLWDICHLDSPEFPEVRTSYKFEDREDFYSKSLRKAALVVVDSTPLRENTAMAYGLHGNKFVTIPFSPPATLAAGETSSELPSEVRDLTAPYFFYPAQLWGHKNHVRIAEAIAQLTAEGHDFHAVFVGKDHGAGATIAKRIASLGVSDRVHFLGYVSDQAMGALYQNASALVMASYFGPTNIPPLEAFQLGVPVIASLIHNDQLAQGALYFDPDDEVSLSEAMLAVQIPLVREQLVLQGEELLKSLDAERAIGEKSLIDSLTRLSRRLL